VKIQKIRIKEKTKKNNEFDKNLAKMKVIYFIASLIVAQDL
jgi:hypothetical protein